MTTPTGLQIGWASREIVPDRPVNLRGQFHMRISKGVLDPVTVTALSVSSGADAFIWVSCDLCGVPEAVLALCREKLKRRAPDFPSEKLVMNATHTHTAPDPSGTWYPNVPAGVMNSAEFGEFLSERVAEAAAESWKARKPGAVSWGYGHAVVSHNRRAVYFDDLSKRPDFVELPGTKTEKNARMYGNTNDPQFSGIEGYVDHGLNVLFTFDAQKQLTGAIVNLHCPSQETEHLEQMSADFWNETRTELRKRYGASFFVLPQCAPSGDLSPHLLYNKKAEERMLKLKGRTSRQEIACRLASAVDEVYQWAKKDIQDGAVLKHSVRTINLARRIVSEEEYRHARRWIEELGKAPPPVPPGGKQSYLDREDVRFSRQFRCKRVVDRYEQQKTQPALPMELHVIRLGDVALATNTFELFLDFGLRMIARSPATQTFLAQLCAGGTASYLATERGAAGESYSACVYCNEVSPQGGQQLVDETVKDLKALWA